MDVTAKYELIGLMAYPIRHSLSPEMQNKALEKAGLPFTYMAFEVDNSTFAGAIEGLKALKMRGTGVSMPNKQLACEFVDELTRRRNWLARLIPSSMMTATCVVTIPTAPVTFAQSKRVVSISRVKPWYYWVRVAPPRPLVRRQPLRGSKRLNSLTAMMNFSRKRWTSLSG